MTRSMSHGADGTTNTAEIAAHQEAGREARPEPLERAGGAGAGRRPGPQALVSIFKSGLAIGHQGDQEAPVLISKSGLAIDPQGLQECGA